MQWRSRIISRFCCNIKIKYDALGKADWITKDEKGDNLCSHVLFICSPYIAFHVVSGIIYLESKGAFDLTKRKCMQKHEEEVE